MFTLPEGVIMKKLIGNILIGVFLIALYAYIWHLTWNAVAYEMLRASRIHPIAVEGK